jgi:hypothetical protein
MQPVGALAADLDRRGGRNRQLDLTPEGLEQPVERILVRRSVLAEGVALGIAGRRP